MSRHPFLAALLAVLLLAGCGSQPRQPNIVVVVLDTVRRDATGLPQPTTPRALRRPGLTPNLDRLAAEGVAFAQAWSAAPWTLPSHASMMTGMLPSQHLCLMIRPALDADIPTAPEQLAQAGYETAAFFSNPWLGDDAARVLRGFDTKIVSDIGNLHEMASAEGDQGGHGTLRHIRQWFADRRDDRPFLMFVNFLEAHLAYDPPGEYRAAHLGDLGDDDMVGIEWGHEVNAQLIPSAGEDWDRVARLYAGDVWFADQLLGQLLAVLDEQGLGGDTVVIVTSDHGENLGDHGLAEHQFSVHETLLAVPLVVRVPDAVAEAAGGMPGLAGAGRWRSDPVMTTDLYATLLDLAGLDEALAAAPPASRSWLAEPDAGPRAVIAEYGGPGSGLVEYLQSLNPAADLSHLNRAQQTVRVGDLRLTTDIRGNVELNDMAQDPGQNANLAELRPRDVEALRRILHDATGARSRTAEPVGEMDPETRRRLKSLGYVR